MAVYKPDRHFVRLMREIDPKLEARWSASLQRWVIYRRVRDTGHAVCEDGTKVGYLKDRFAEIMVVKNDDGSYRPLDERTIRELRYCDAWRLRRPGYEIERRIDLANEKVKENQEKKMDELNLEGSKTLWDRVHEKKFVDLGATA